MSRPKQSRRLPQSSMGSISLSSEVPRFQGIHEYTHHSANSNASLPSLGSAAGVSAQERIVKSLVDKMIAKMPSYSGLTLSALEVDESLIQVHEALLQLSRHCANIIVWSLCEILDKFQKKHVGPDTSLDVLESEIYIVRVLTLILNFRSNIYKEERAQLADDDQTSTSSTLHSKRSDQNFNSTSPLVEPPALEDNVAKYCLVVMLGFIRRSGPTKADALSASGKLDTLNILHDFESFQMDSAVLHVTRRLPYKLDINSTLSKGQAASGSSAMAHTNHSMSSFSSNGMAPDVASHIPSAAAVRSSSFASDAPMIITHLAGKVIFYLSASNWPIVFSRIRNRIHYFAANMEDEGLDIVDLRLLTYSGIDKNRLVQVLQELSSLFVNMKPDVQGAVAVALRTVVWKWIEDLSDEFIEVVQSSRRGLDGQPERVFDLLYQLVDSANKRTVWPTLAVLVAISPERLKAAEAAWNGTLPFGKKHNNYLEHLHSALTTQSKLGDIAVMCFNDICRAACHLPPLAENTVLRSLAPDLADDLKSRLMNPPYPARPFFDSSEPIDVTLYGDTLVNILRYHPMVALVSVLPACLEAERSAAVKLCVVRALTILVTETPKFPWLPALDKSIYNFVAPRLRAMAIDLATSRNGHHYTARPLSARDGTPTQPGDDRRELIISLHALWRLDFGFFFSNMTQDEYKPFIDASLKVLQQPKDDSIQISTLRTIGAFLAKVNNPHDEYFDLVNEFMYHAVDVTMRCAAEELLRVDDDFEENLRCLNLIIAILSQIVDRDVEGRQAWKHTEKREVTLMIVETALLVQLISPRLEICSSAAKAARLMVMIQQDPYAQPPKFQTPLSAPPDVRAPLFELLGDPKSIVLGRVDFQKRMRHSCSARAYPCVIHLASWKEVYYRWGLLKPVIISAGGRSSTDIHLSNGSLNTQSFEEKHMEWENLTLALAAAAGACTNDDPALNPPQDYPFPFRRDITDQKPTELVKRFIQELIELLIIPSVSARLVARDALGIDLHPKMFQCMFEHLDIIIGEIFGEEGDYFGPRDPDILFVDQVISILKLIMDRVGVVEESLIKVDIGENLRTLARFIHRGEPNTSERRIKSRFCALIDNILEKRDKLRIREESAVRNSLLDIIADWVLEYPSEWPEDDITRNEQIKAQRDSNLAALKTCVKLLENLRLHAYDGSTGSDSAHVVSRLFHRYFTIFVMALGPRPRETESIMESDQMSQQSNFSGKNDALVQELVISGIANMLHANTDAGTKHVLTLGYKDNSRLRAVFAHVFCRVLNRGTKFDNYLDGLAQTSRKSRLCEMVRDSEIITQAIIDVCPMSDIDSIIPVLLNIYDTRRTLLNLLKMIIRRQVEITSSDTELFRSNDMCSRILSAFAKQHGYNYLRSIVTPLISFMLDLPPDAGYELDAAKLRPGESVEANAETLKTLTKAFLTIISDTVGAIPLIIREVCRYIEDSVTAVWPESRYVAVGAFIFLRFIVPAIVAPETVDIELPRNDPRTVPMRRGLLLVAKIIQNLANNILFGKEQHMTILNPFLLENIAPVTGFHTEILKVTPEQVAQNPEEWLGTSYDETDTIILHRFFQKNADKVGKVLLSLSRMTNSHEVMSVSGKRTWDTVCSLLVEMGPAMEPPTVIDQPSNKHKIFRAFMLKNGHRNTDSVREIFQNTMSLKDQRPLFILALSKINVETVDLELLMCYIFKTIRERTSFEQPFDLIIDCTSFTSASEVPLSWCKLCMEHMPSDLRLNFEMAYILNTNLAAQKFLRKLYHVCSDAKFPNGVLALSSIAELAELVHPASLTPMSYATTVESESSTVYHCQQHQRNQIKIPIILQVGISHIRLTSVNTQYIYPSLSAKTVEVIPLVDIGDVCIVSSRNEASEFLIRRTLNGGNITFSSSERDNIIKAIRLAKSRFQISRPLIPAERSPRLADVSAALLNVGLLNVCDEDESLRGAAYDLLFAVCAYVNYEANPLVPLRGPFIPSNTAAFILPFSERLANFVPQLTLDLISEFALGFEKASTAQKITCIQYLNPWIKNLAMFAKPTDPNYDHTGGKLKDSIRSLIDITVKFPDVYPTLQRSVWTELGRHDTSLLNIVLEELMRAAIDGGLGSARCEQIADTLIAMSSINVRAKVLSKLRRVLSKASIKSTRSLTQSPMWNEITALARLALVAGYSSRLAVQNLMFVPEIAHLTTILCATGTSGMKRTVYGIAMGLVQSLHIARANEEGPANELKKILDDASNADTLQKFGLVRAHASSEYTSIENAPDQISMAALDGITELLIKALTHGAQTLGLLNVWRSRWMSLVTATAFQICPYVQYRAFVVLGLLASSDNAGVDDDLLYQMLVAFKNALAASADMDPGPVTSMLRCIAKVIPGIGPDSRYLPQVFWLAVALLQSTYLPLYGEAARLLEATLEIMARQGMFKDRRMSEVLLEARIPLTDITTQLDSIMGISFETSFSFSLASIIFRGVRPPAVRPIAQRVLGTVLRIAAESSAEQMELDSDAVPVPLDHDVLGYFLALLPFAHNSSAYQELLKEARVGTRWWPPLSPEDDGEDDTAIPRVSIDLFGFSLEDRNTPLLVLSFVFAMLNSYQGSEQEKEFLFALLGQLGHTYPELCASAVVHYLVNPRSEWLLNNLTDTVVGSPETSSSVQVLFRIAMTSSVWSAAASTTVSTATESDFLAGQRTPHYKALEELDMHALSVQWQFLPKGSAERILQWIPLLVEAIIE